MKSTNLSKPFKRVGYGLLVCFSTLILTAQAAEILQLETGSQQVMREEAGVARVAVGDPKVADVSMLDRYQIMLSAKAAGRTTLSVWTGSRKTLKTYDLVVADHGAPAAVTNPASVKTQVQTDIKVAEMSRKTLRQFGFNYLKNQASETITSLTPGSLGGIESGGGGINVLGANGFVPLSNAFNLVFGNGNRNTAGVLSVLEQRGLVRVLAEPSLVAMSGQTASFLAGGEFPIPVQQSGSGGNNTVTIEFKEFGVRLNLTPTVLDNERIVLRVAPEVSELDFTAAVVSGGVQVPALTVRRTETTVELGNGESFLISGLVSQNTIGNVDKVPLLGDIPILGAFFRSTQFDREEKELVMVVTPHLVDPLRRGAELPAMPGARYDNYNPGNAHVILNERGDFDPEATGFSMGIGN